MKSTTAAAFAALTLATALGGCQRTVTNEGFIADEQLLASVQPGVDTRDSVQRALGKPTLQGKFDDREWYYVSRLSKQLAFLRPTPSAQTILIVRFNEAGVVEKVERRGLEKVANITPNSDKTPTLGRETGLLEDLFGNIGQFGGAGAGGAGPDGPR